MPSPCFARRGFIVGAGAIVAANILPAAARADPTMLVFKDPDCGCCTAWADIMRAQGFRLRVQNVSREALARLKAQSGISADMASCHTAQMEGYVIEGHVPAADIRRLLAERPDAVGLSVPGMPYGSPGMGPDAERDAYSVHLILKDGSSEVFAHYEGN